MDKEELFKGIYKDFFGIDNLTKKNERLAKDLQALNDEEVEIPEIDVEKAQDEIDIEEENKKVEKASKENRDNKQADLFVRIDGLFISDESKELMKKVIEYMRKYNEGIEKRFIPFNFAIYSKDKELTLEATKIIEEGTSFFDYLKEGKIVQTSFYNIEKVDELADIYNSNPSIVLLKDFESLAKADTTLKEKLIHKIDEKIEEKEETTITIASARSKDSLIQAISEDVVEKYFDFEIVEDIPDIPVVYENILEEIKASMEIDDKMQVEILDYVTATFANTNLSYAEYKDDVVKKILFTKKVPTYEKEKSLEEIFAELDELVGLQDVKKVLRDLVDLIELKKKAKDDLKIKDVNLHMVFLGNPGTGKTTVARHVAEILYNLKYIKQNKLLEVSSKDLVAEYVGQTAPKTMAVIEKARGGVLFVDEAYSLASGKGDGNSFNEEAIATLIKAMEDYRDELVVIFAGYTKEMQDFLNANSGIVSRIGYTVEFKDYTVDELLEIFKGFMKKSGFEVTKEALEEVKKVTLEYKDTENFGNARFVRNVYEKTVIKHASNTKDKKGKKQLRTITKEDISTENLLKM